MHDSACSLHCIDKYYLFKPIHQHEELLIRQGCRKLLRVGQAIYLLKYRRR